MFTAGLPIEVPQVPTRRALLILDLQNDFVKQDGALFVRNAPEFLEKVAALVPSFRETGEVVWVQTIYNGHRPLVNSSTGGPAVLLKDNPGSAYSSGTSFKPINPNNINIENEDDEVAVDSDPEASDNWDLPAKADGASSGAGDPSANTNDPEAFLSVPDSLGIPRCCAPRSVGAQFPAPVVSAIDYEQDTVLVKSDYSAFQDTGLIPLFRSQFVTEVYVCGSLSNVSVYATVQDAVTHGLTVTLIEDCLGHRSFSRHLSAMRAMADIMGANGISTEELLQEHDIEEAERASHADLTSSRQSIAADTGIESDLGVLGVQTEQHQQQQEESTTRGTTEEPEGRQQREQRPRMLRTRKPRMRPRPSDGESRQTGQRSGDTRDMTPDPATPPPADKTTPKKSKNTPGGELRGPGDSIGEGDSSIVHDLDLPSDTFQRLRGEVNWQKMYHMSGQVPRLVAVQGAVQSDGSIPIYRHPADESPPLYPFTATVDIIRGVVEKLLGHPLNHVLIQLYRDGQDRISEHSDKTLDIVRGSYICNVSLGAQRAMTLRTKKSAQEEEGAGRQSQRVPMPHNSLFVLGESTNMKWLHGIRADKRPESTKTAEELAFNGERISLTFRSVGTFINPEADTIWGQGAVSKTKEGAGRIMHGESTETEGMICAFGKENHATDFEWDEYYGKGFDVVNFATTSTAKVAILGDEVEEMRVRLCLAENGVRYEVVEFDELPSETRAASQGQQAILLDADERCVSGTSNILAHIGRLLRAPDTPDPETLLGGYDLSTRLRAADELLLQARMVTRGEAQTDGLVGQLSFFEGLLEGAYGTVFGIDDCAVWPVIRYLMQSREGTEEINKYPGISAYYAKVGRRGCVRTVLEDMK